jgi:ribosomal protein S2
MLDRRSTGIDLIYRGSAKRFSFYTYAQLIFHNINLGGFVKEIKGTSFWFLYAKKDDFVFLNLMPTLLMLRGVVRILESVVSSRGKMMFVNNDLDLF